MKKYNISYMIGAHAYALVANSTAEMLKRKSEIIQEGGKILAIRERVKILETIDYTLSRKGHRQYVPVYDNRVPVIGGGSWKTLSDCKAKIREMGMEFTGIITVNQNYSHWADFHPVKEGVMADG